MLKQGDAAMINFGTFFGASLDGVGMKAGSDYDYFIIPAVDSSLSKTPVPVETGPLCVANSSKQKDLGLAYSKWWMTASAQSAWGNARGDVPFNPKATVKDAGLKTLGTEIARRQVPARHALLRSGAHPHPERRARRVRRLLRQPR